MSAIIEVNHLTKKFGAFTAVNDLSFTVEEGDIYGFLGQNGAGKSTTIRMLLTLIRPSSGSIQLFGKELSAHRHSILKEVGAVIEKPDTYKYLSAYQNLEMFARMSGIKAKSSHIYHYLEMVGLEKRAKDKVKTFSQGMKQRLGIAIALVHNPGLIILDEPTNGLDPQGIADIRQLILQLSKEMGKTVVVSSHLLSEIEVIANRMIIIDRGKKIVEGAVSELLDPAQTLVQIETTDDGAANDFLVNSSWQPYLVANAQYITLQMNKEQTPSLIKSLTSKDIGILSVQSSHSLEKYFLSLTNPLNHVDLIAD